MSPLPRLIVIVLLLLALPLQALASSRMGTCHDGAAGSAGHGVAMAAAHGGEAPPCHDELRADLPADLPADTCSVCAACCLAVALPAVVAAPAGAGAQTAPQFAVPPEPLSAPTARLERPPRTPHAGRL